MRRRTLLWALVGAVSVTGCLGGDDPVEAPPTDSPTPSPTTTYPRSEPGTALRCRGEPVTVERSVTDRPGYDDDIRYFPANGTVKFVAGRSGDEPAWFETMSAEEWAAIQCAEAGLDRVRTVTADRLGTSRFGAGVGQPPEGVDAAAPVVTLAVDTRRGPDGQRRTPAVGLRWLADVAPRAVDATVSLDGDAFSRSVPVFATHRTVGPA